MLVSVGISATKYIDVNVETVFSSHFKCLHLKGSAVNSRLLDTKSSLNELKNRRQTFWHVPTLYLVHSHEQR